MQPNKRADDAPDFAFWREEIKAGQTSYDLFRVMRRLSLAHDFVYFSIYRWPNAFPARLADHTLINTLPQELIRRFDELGLMGKTDACRALGATIEPQFLQVGAATVSQDDVSRLQLRELLTDFDLTMIGAMPLRAGNGEKGVFFLGGKRPEPSHDEVLTLHFLGSLAFDQLIRQAGPAKADAPGLTERERECLFWTAAGKTSTEIGAILGISVHTVDHYLTTAGQKLDTVNRAHAVATALRRGLIR